MSLVSFSARLNGNIAEVLSILRRAWRGFVWTVLALIALPHALTGGWYRGRGMRGLSDPSPPMRRRSLKREAAKGVRVSGGRRRRKQSVRKRSRKLR
jgi:hypothetical protein